MEKALRFLKHMKQTDTPYNFRECELDEAIAELEEDMKPKTCKWHKEDDEDWRGECGCVWGFNGENPTKAEAYFCPQCGGKIIEIDMGDNK